MQNIFTGQILSKLYKIQEQEGGGGGRERERARERERERACNEYFEVYAKLAMIIFTYANSTSASVSYASLLPNRLGARATSASCTGLN